MATATVPNQRIVICGPRPPCDKEHPYFLLNRQTTFEALRALEHVGALKLYMYLAHFSNGFKVVLSFAAVGPQLNITRYAYTEGIKELIEKGFLAPEASNKFFFRADARQQTI